MQQDCPACARLIDLFTKHLFLEIKCSVNSAGSKFWVFCHPAIDFNYEII